MTTVAVFNVLIKVWVAAEVAVLLLTHTRRSQGSLNDRGSLLLLFPAITMSIWLGGSYGDSHPHTLFGGTHWVILAALIILIAGLLVRWTAILSLGRAFSVNVAIQTGQTVKQNGLYRFVRHPSYTGSLLCFLAFGLSTRNWIALLLVVAPVSAAFLYRMHIEEAALTNAFGTEYTAYSAATKRLIPGVY